LMRRRRLDTRRSRAVALASTYGGNDKRGQRHMFAIHYVY
jgi:hypothetical protein